MRGALKGIRKQTAHTGPGHRLSGCLSIICGAGSLQMLLPRPRLGRNPGYAPHNAFEDDEPKLFFHQRYPLLQGLGAGQLSFAVERGKQFRSVARCI